MSSRQMEKEPYNQKTSQNQRYSFESCQHKRDSEGYFLYKDMNRGQRLCPWEGTGKKSHRQAQNWGVRVWKSYMFFFSSAQPTPCSLKDIPQLASFSPVKNSDRIGVHEEIKNLAATPLTSLQEALCWPLTIVLSLQPASVAPWLLSLSQVQWRHCCQPDIQRQLKVPSFYSAGKEFYGLLILWWKINLVLK